MGTENRYLDIGHALNMEKAWKIYRKSEKNTERALGSDRPPPTV